MLTHVHSSEPIAVGLVLKNPLRIPLLMANLTLTWKFSSSLGGNPSVSFFTASSDAPPTSSPPEANCEVIESVVLKPGEEKMVSCTNTYRYTCIKCVCVYMQYMRITCMFTSLIVIIVYQCSLFTVENSLYVHVRFI